MINKFTKENKEKTLERLGCKTPEVATPKYVMVGGVPHKWVGTELVALTLITE